MKYSIEYIIVVWYPELANCAAADAARVDDVANASVTRVNCDKRCFKPRD